MSNSSIGYNVVSTSGGSNSIQDFRLTLASNTPVMTSEVLAATTLYLTPYTGNKIALYNGSAWDVITSSQVSISLSTISADTNYDVFAYNNSGTVTLELLAWSNSGAGTSTRATALTYQDGVLVRSGSATRRYIGTIRGSASGQCQFSFGGTSLNGTEAKLYVWNYYNRVDTKAFVASNSSWTFTSASTNQYRAALNSPTYRVSFVQGLAENNVDAEYLISANINAAGTNTMNGVGLNSTTSPSGASYIYTGTSPVIFLTAKLNKSVSVGFNFISALDGNYTANIVTYFYNIDPAGTHVVGGLYFNGWF